MSFLGPTPAFQYYTFRVLIFPCLLKKKKKISVKSIIPESSDRIGLAEAAFDRVVGLLSCRQPMEDGQP